MLRQPKRIATVDNLATGSKLQGENLKVAGLFPINNNGGEDLSKFGNIDIKEVGFFLLNPTSIQDNKSSNWARQPVPGQSDPIFQWVSSGERTISFEALVTAETSDFISGQKKKPGEETDPLKKATTFIGSLAMKFFKVATAPPRIENDDDLGTDLDISNYLNYYRSLLYPTYNDTNGRLESSPPLLVFYYGSSINNLELGGAGTRVNSQHDLWFLEDLQITITKQLPNLAPMEAVVNFKLVQYNIRSFDRRRFLR